MSGKGRWVKPAGRTAAPSRWVSVVLEPATVARSAPTGGEFHVWGRGAATAATWRRGRWSVGETVVCTLRSTLLTYIQSQASDRRSTWVVSPCSTSALTLLGMWEEWTRCGAIWAGKDKPPGRSPAASPCPPAGSVRSPVGSAHASAPVATDTDKYSVHTLIPRGNPTIVKYSHAGRHLTWVSGSQYTGAGVDALARAVGIAHPCDDDRSDDGYIDFDYSHWSSRVWLKYMCDLSDWWRSVDGGPWSATAGGLGMSYIRKRIQPKTLLSHDDHAARALEERALHGGRASVYFVGPVGAKCPAPPGMGAGAAVRQYPAAPGPVEMWDVRSMYPTILQTQEFPVRYIGTTERPPVKLLGEMLADYCVIADVELVTAAGEYPVRDADRLTFPAGAIRAVLCGPELRRALAAGEVQRCHRAATYRRGRPFALGAAELVAHRRAAEAKGRDLHADFVKMLSNAFSGKMAQRKYDWERRPDVAPYEDWGEWWESGPKPGDRRRYRAAAGLVWERTPHEHSGRPLAACYAYLTSYGRDVMRTARAHCPPRSVVSQDTDGLWVCGDGRAAFTEVSQVLASEGYTLTRRQSSRWGRWLGPRHYLTEAGWVLAGFHRPAYDVSEGRLTDRYTLIPPLGTSASPPVSVLVMDRSSTLLGIDADGAVDPDGWVRPRVVRARDTRVPESSSQDQQVPS